MIAGDEEFGRRLLAAAYVLAAVSPKHRLASKKVLEITELANESLLLLRRDFASRGWFDTACHVARIKPRVILESAAPHTLLTLARTGNDVAEACIETRSWLAILFTSWKWVTRNALMRPEPERIRQNDRQNGLAVLSEGRKKRCKIKWLGREDSNLRLQKLRPSNSMHTPAPSPASR